MRARLDSSLAASANEHGGLDPGAHAKRLNAGRTSLRLGLLALALWAFTPVLAQPIEPRPEAATAPRILVSKFRITGNTLLPQSQLDPILAPYQGERTADDLKQAALAIQQQYVRAGYGAVVAFVAPQGVEAGVVTITVLEGKLRKITITGHRQFNEDNIRASIPALAVEATPRLDLADAQIQITNENPAKQVQILLQPGQATGDVEARVMVTEEPVRRWSVGLDNRGTARTGDLRAYLGWQHANVLGRDHVFSALFQTSPDKPSAVKVASAGYRVPLYGPRMAIDAYAAYSDVSPGTTATVAGDLQFNGRGRLFGVRATRYLTRLGPFDHRVSVGLDQRDYLNDCAIVGFDPGACGVAGASVSVQPLSLEYLLQKGGATRMSAGIGVIHNLQIGGGRASDEHFENARPGAKPRFTALRFSASGTRPLATWLHVNARFAAQLTRDGLVPGEQFGIGGAGSVRGYEERELAGDSGAAASLELTSANLAPTVGMGTGSGDLRALAFADGGWVRNRLGTPCLDDGRISCSQRSVGIGARYGVRRFQAQLSVAQALKASALTGRNDVRTHVALSYSF